MIVYNKNMRVRDENKKEAIFDATISLINEIGLANLSMSQIGERAGVSSSTIYVYFENKDDMLKKVYLDVREKLSAALSRNIDQSAPVRQIMERVVRNILDFAEKHTTAFFFLEQFSNAPMPGESCVQDTVKMLRPVFDVIERGQREGILKKSDPVLLWTFCYYGVTQIIKARLMLKQEIIDSQVKELAQMCWDAIKA
jgi:AcrR family transcriptional regulator